MRNSASFPDLNIQKKHKTGRRAGTDTSICRPPLEVQITVLAALLGSPHFVADTLRVLVGLVRRLPPPENPYTGKELETLLLLTLALERAGMWP